MNLSWLTEYIGTCIKCLHSVFNYELSGSLLLMFFFYIKLWKQKIIILCFSFCKDSGSNKVPAPDWNNVQRGTFHESFKSPNDLLSSNENQIMLYHWQGRQFIKMLIVSLPSDNITWRLSVLLTKKKSFLFHVKWLFVIKIYWFNWQFSSFMCALFFFPAWWAIVWEKPHTPVKAVKK